jgi:beta-galactosidase
MPQTTLFNDNWQFDGAPVRLPHNAVDLPYSYFDENSYQRPFTYEKTFANHPDWAGREVCLRFDGAMANAKVYLNGAEIAAHADGYTPFEARLTGALKAGENSLKVVIDGAENPAIPPFGGAIDYLTYAGIYRDVWIETRPALALGLIKVETPDVLAQTKTVAVTAQLRNPQGLALAGKLTAILRDAKGQEIAQTSAPVAGAATTLRLDGLKGIALWDIDAPHLYTIEVLLDAPSGADSVTTTFGFRAAEFTPDGFLLNGRPLKLRGLNRHQSFPYVGYALGKSAQERDAEILKHELHVNLVRTSHYPQSKWFLDHCDRIGLLVFEEIPGWQHIGDRAWQAASVENVRAMITRDWNHPSIIIWGVRINESQDNHDFYTATNAMARSLDTTRQTGGVRYITGSELLEDVYTMNDFIMGEFEHGGNRPRTALRPQQEVTGLKRNVPYIVTEYNGHMYPTKMGDQEQRQAEHVTRHLEVLDAAYGDPNVSGCIGWCAFDYNTHKDFGSGDRICHHGVMDMFREPKFAAYAYASQCAPDEAIVMEPVTYYARGERNIGGILPLIVLTNCDEVELQYGNNAPKRVQPDRAKYPNLPHAPVVITKDNFSAAELGQWGMKWESGQITGYLNGKAVATRRFACDPLPTTLQVAPDALNIGADDSLRVMIRVLDQVGNKLPFMTDSVDISVTGPAQRLGPQQVPLRAGATGFWLQATGAGDITVRVSHPRLGTATVQIAAKGTSA